MLPYDIIMKKRNGDILTKEEIDYFISGYTSGSIPDYQASALLMAIFIRGMNDNEIAYLTEAMVNSGDLVDLSPIEGIKVDKHSTGGVGDTTTLILAPLVAAAGVPVAKMSGRGLGHTGGTLDKLESIPGMTVNLSADEFIQQVKKIGISVIGQTADLVPADKKIYALRDVTATVDSVPLIAASVMSKKIAAGTDAIVLDVKMGNGAFMTNYGEAKILADVMVNIGNIMGRKTRALITDMNQPLGTHIGNALEVKEAIEILQGKHKGSPLYEVSLILGAHMLLLGKAAESIEEGIKKLERLLETGKGAIKMQEFIQAQKGNPAVVENPELLPQAPYKIEIKSEKSGYIHSFDTSNIGRCALLLGAGRAKKEDTIDPSVGLILNKRIGDKIEFNEPIATIYSASTDKIESASEALLSSIEISDYKPTEQKLIWDVVTGVEVVSAHSKI
jgi:pyrimidine-nucleoside phosphorylase